MKYLKNEAGQVAHWEGETDAEKAAIDYVASHVPWIAGTEPYGITAFQAGVAWAEDRAARQAAEHDAAMASARHQREAHQDD